MAYAHDSRKVSVIRRIFLKRVPERRLEHVLAGAFDIRISERFERVSFLHVNLVVHGHRVMVSVARLDDHVGWVRVIGGHVFDILLVVEPVVLAPTQVAVVRCILPRVSLAVTKN